MRFRQAFYVAFGMKDGTILSALQTRRPTKKQLRPRERIDDDGIYRWHTMKVDKFVDMEARHEIVWMLAITSRLNTRRAIRELVSQRLGAIEAQVACLSQQLDRLSELVERASLGESH